MRSSFALLAVAGLSAFVLPSLAIAAPMSIEQAAKLFGSRPTGFAPDLSPDGDKLVYLSAGPGASTIVHIAALNTDSDRELAQSSGKPDKIRWCKFANETWIVCRWGENVRDDGITFGASRAIAINTATGKIEPLGATDKRDADPGIEQYDGDIIDWLPDDSGALLMARRYPAAHGFPNRISVDKITVDPFSVSVIEPATSRDVAYMTDGHGSVRLRDDEKSDIDHEFTGAESFDYRTPKSSEWLPLHEGGPDFHPLAVDKSTNSLYFLKPLDGREALYRMTLDSTGSEQLVASNPSVDIENVIQLGPGDPVVGYQYTDDKTHSVYIDNAMKHLGDELAKALPNRPLIDFIGRSKDGQKILLHVASDVDPGVFFILDRSTNRMEPVLNSNDLIDGSGLAPMRAVSVPTKDGKSIPAYVTMRSDLSAGPHPAIVMPHGGPSERDSWGFDWLGQFLAARGYVVIQPNFRGSSGYGQEFLGENAFHEWRKVMSDIHDSADWLVKERLADPNRMAILGWSYGGYAALQSSAMDSRYKAVIAIAPVTDLKQLRREAEHFRGATIEQKEIGKGDQLVDGSPITHAADIHAPVLLVHGTIDGNVEYDHSKRMLAALKKAGATADLLTFPGLDHQLDNSDARTTMLTRIGQLLDERIGH